MKLHKLYEDMERYHNGFVINLPNIRQPNEWSCGVAALQIVLAHYGLDINESDLEEMANVSSETGTEMEDIVRVAKEQGLKAKMMKMSIAKLKKYISKNIPVILLLQAYSESERPYAKSNNVKDSEEGHYVVANGFGEDFIVFQDPAMIGRTYLKDDELDIRWRGLGSHNNVLDHYAIAIIGEPVDYSSMKLKRMP